MHYLSNFDIKCSVETKEELVKTMGSIHDGVALYCKDYFERYLKAIQILLITRAKQGAKKLLRLKSLDIRYFEHIKEVDQALYGTVL